MLELRNLSKSYGDYKAVNSINITLPKGEVLGLLGRNGAGKSTTIKMILGLAPMDEGEVLWDGKPFKRKELKIGYLPEERGLYDKTKVYDQLLFFGLLEKMKKSDVQKQIDFWLERFEIPQYKHKLLSELSKGNKQKIQLITTLLHDPDLVILDEPFSGLDPVNANVFSEIISELIQQEKTVILSSHRMEQLESFCKHIIMLKQGNTMLQGTLDEIKLSYGVQSVFVHCTEGISDWLQTRNYTFEQKDNGYYVSLQQDTEAIHLFHLLKESGFTVREFIMKEPSLHDIFVERVR
ncbi:ABC transporter ATP-binding protein [Priestia megaterium]|nr:ABC transporter ATP-binding protein [Priestia megaterium]